MQAKQVGNVIDLVRKSSRRKAGEEHGLPSLSLVFGYIAVKELKLLRDRVRVLARLGYGNAEIAKICGTTRAAVATLKAAGRGRRRRGA